MITPTSVSSRSSASPVMPLPKSSTSLSISSARPSTLATPSPISRITPTFCLAAVALTPAICASISLSKSAICPSLLIVHCKSPFERAPQTTRSIRADSKPFLQCGQLRLHAAVEHIAADLNPHPANQRWVSSELDVDSGAVGIFQASPDVRPQISRQRRRGLDFGSVRFAVQSQQTLKL